ncbi:MAG: sirohydrochlorin cobaltochelatase [Synergistaceae bacterium]
MHNKTPKKAILIASFGTSLQSGQRAIDNLVNKVKSEYSNYDIKITYTSNIIRKKLKKEHNIIIDTPLQALANMQDENYTHVYVMPMHIIPGEEYEDLKSVISSFTNIKGKYSFELLRIGRPFLFNIPSCDEMANILIRRFEKEISENKTIVLMGHGTPRHISHALYSQLQISLTKKAPGKFVIGTVEGAPLIEDVISKLKHIKAKEIVLSPFMIVAGDHATNDLADKENPESWYSQISEAGFRNINTRLEGLGEDIEIATLFASNIKELLN